MEDMDLTVSEKLRKEKTARLLRTLVLRELTQTQREVFLAYHYRGMMLKDIARERNCNISTVSRTLRRAEAKIRRVLELFP